MKSTTLFMLAAILVSFGCAPPESESGMEATAIDLEREREAIMAAENAVAESVYDIDAFLSFFTDDAQYLPFGAPLAEGDGIRATWEGLLSLPEVGLNLQATDVTVATSGDIGYTTGTFDLTYAQDGTTMLTQGKYVTVWHKQADGSWKIKVDIGNANGPPTATDN